MNACFDFTNDGSVEMPDGKIPSGNKTLLRQIQFHDDGVIVLLCEEKGEVTSWLIEPPGKKLVTVKDGKAYVADDDHDKLRIRRN